MQSYAGKFGSLKDAENCSALNNAGSVVLVAPTKKCSSEPDIYRVAAAAAGAIGAESLSVYLGGILPVGVANPNVYLQQGTKLYFGDPAVTTPPTKVATVTEDVLITAVTATTAVNISVEPLADAIVLADQAKTWGLIRVIGSDGLDLNIQAGTENTSTLANGLKGQNETTSLMMDGNLSMILEPDDPAFWRILHNAAVTGKHFFLMNARTGNTFAWGEAQTGNYSRPGQKQSVQKATLAINMQDDWAAPTMYKYLSASEQLIMQEVCRLSGLKLPTLV
jgi:hypothetical protein